MSFIIKIRSRDAAAVLNWIGLLDWNYVCLLRSSHTFLTEAHSRDDDDEFLYGDSELKESSLSNVPADLVVAAPVPSSSGENTSSCICILLRRVLYPTRPKRNINSTFLAHFSFLACASVSVEPPDE
jgi:hypothetical protein